MRRQPDNLHDAHAALVARSTRTGPCLLAPAGPRYLNLAYGRPRRWISAHRLAYIVAHGTPPIDRPWVLHRCIGRKRCIEPTHLYPGDARQNNLDTRNAGRAPRGTRHPRATLTPWIVREARRRRRRGARFAELGALFSANPATIRAAVVGQNWAWLK